MSDPSSVPAPSGPAADLSYQEKSDNLEIRIRAHRDYANFELEDWIAANLPIPRGGALLDIGCGDGNLFACWDGLLGPEGLIVGIDQSDALLTRAEARTTQCRRLLLTLDMNELTGLRPRSFDVAVAAFSIYYAEDPAGVLARIRALLKPGGTVILMGPTASNAEELYRLNSLVFGFPSENRGLLRTARLQDEFLPAAQALFPAVKTRVVQRELRFPSVADYIRYYRATLLFEESCGKAGRTPEAVDIAATGWDLLTLSKEIVVIEARL